MDLFGGFKYIVLLILLLLGLVLILGATLTSQNIRMVLLLLIFVALWRLFKEQFGVSESASLFLAMVITYFLWMSFAEAMLLFIGFLLIVAAIRAATAK